METDLHGRHGMLTVICGQASWSVLSLAPQGGAKGTTASVFEQR